MTCRDVDALVTRHVDGELDDARASALRGHLRSCAACRARVEDEALLRDSAADLAPIDPPAELWDGIQARLAEAEVADAGRSRAWLWWQRLRPHALTGAVVTAGHGSRFAEGTIVGVVVSGVTYPVLITSISTDTLTWWPALPSAPSVAGVVYNSQSNYLTDTPVKWIQMLAEDAKDRNNIWLGVGGQGDFTLDMSRGQLAKWGSSLKFAKWLHDDEITTPQGGSAIALASYTGGGPIYANEGGCHFGATGSTTRALVRVQSLAITFGVEWFEVGLHSGTEGLGQWERNTRPEITAELTLLPPSNYEAYHDFWSAETDVGFLFWLGSAAGSIPAVCAPTCQIMKAPEPAEVFGMEGLKLSLLIKENSLSSAQTTEVQRSPISLAAI